jgi:primosomal protein N' (replication factor Y)
MESDDRYIEIAVDLPVYHTFTYSAPETLSTLIDTGKRVLVPFRRRRVTGYVLGESKGLETKEIKPILDILDEAPLFRSTMVPFFQWIADYYKFPIGQVIKNALPGGLNVRDHASLTITDKGIRALQENYLTPVEKKILHRLESGSCRVRDLYQKIDRDLSSVLLYSLEERGWIARKWELSGARTKARQERFLRLTEDQLEKDLLSTPRQKIIDVLSSEGEISVKKLKEKIPTAPALIRSLEAAGFVAIESKRVFRDPFGESIEPDTAPMLNQEQKTVVDRVVGFLNRGYATFLLRGVTGSGKTEVYMQTAAEVLKSGLSVLVLVPEIALITQMERRFRARFGACVSVLHSGLSSGERYDQWTRIVLGDATIAIGARSAVFAPFDKLGLIIVDEEHDSSYKQESTLRYNARDLAVVRAKQNNCIALLGSATPSIQSYHNVATQKFRELILEKRVERRSLPEIQIVDLCQYRDTRGIQRFITPELQQAIKTTLDRKEQALLFLNRRGYASFPVCGSCGQSIRCQHCDITLTLHQRANAYRCHYCGFSRAATSSCDACGSTKIKHLGLGTEKLEGMISALFPDARVARMDRDTTVRKGSMLKLLKGLQNETIDILVGTQMVAKGHDFPNITLVGTICADLSLSFPDFRAGERTFQLLAQVAGRAGRGSRPGRVILQTYNPEHFVISAAKVQDFKLFYQREIGYRKALNYPPFTRMIQLKISGKDPAKTENYARHLGERCQALKRDGSVIYRTIDIMGPIEASLTKIAQRYRWQILLNGLNAKALHGFINQLMFENSVGIFRQNIQVVIDVDPVFLM